MRLIVIYKSHADNALAQNDRGEFTFQTHRAQLLGRLFLISSCQKTPMPDKAVAMLPA
jgi:hypothetical protein